MKIKQQFGALIPEWAIAYIEYGESDGLSSEDIREVGGWIKALRDEGYTSPTFDYNWDNPANGFYSHPEFGLGANCVLTTVTQFE